MLEYIPYRDTIVEQSIIDEVKKHIKENVLDSDDERNYTFSITLTIYNIFSENEIIVIIKEKDNSDKYGYRCIIQQGALFRMIENDEPSIVINIVRDTNFDKLEII